MRKIFLSHSSKDKEYVEVVARKIGIDKCTYDKFTFEEGMMTFDEILKGLNETDIFVFFISDASLESKWVREEIGKAKELKDKGDVIRIYPIIIDDKIKYSDSRIPSWMTRNYNIRYIPAPTIAANKIRARMREIVWKTNSKIELQNKFFIGHNEEIKSFEDRRSDFDKPELKGINAHSGFEGMGRRAFMTHVLKKGNIMNASYDYNLITLDQYESIEDFVLKISDLGIGEIERSKVAQMSEDEKIDVAVSMIKVLQEHHEFVFINDKGVIIKPNSEMVEWFRKILRRIDSQMVLGIASIYGLHQKAVYDNPEYQDSLGTIFTTQIKELTKNERRLLLSESCRIHGLNIERDRMKAIADNLSGYPEQVFYVIQMIKDEGIEKVMRKLDEVKEYADSRAQQVFERYADTDDKKDFLVFLSSFDFVSFEILSKVYESNPKYRDYMDVFLSVSICEFIGADGEYIRVNDVLKDTIFRRRLSMGDKLESVFKELVDYTLNDEFVNDTDLAAYYSVIRAKLEEFLNGKESQGLIYDRENIDEKYIIPSHYLKCIVKNYNSRHYDKATRLCKLIIDGGRTANFDDEMVKDIYHYYCQSLAREHKSSEFYDNIRFKGFEEEDREFLKGFYYRINGDPVQAIEHLSNALSIRRRFPRARRELANAYIAAEDYEHAEKLCVENYNDDNRNPYYIQPYFESIIHKYISGNVEKFSEEDADKMEELLDAMEKVGSTQAKQMYACMRAEHNAFIKGDYFGAYSIIEETLGEQLDTAIYLYLTKFDVAYKQQDKDIMKSSIEEIEKQVSHQHYFSNAMNLRKARYYSSLGDKKKAIEMVHKVNNMPTNAMEKFVAEVG